jgi:Protein of unknown function (DUF2905)
MATPVEGLGRALVVLGVVILALGLVLTLAGRIPWLGRLPGDFVYRRGRFTLYVPLATSILLSVLITLVLQLFRR